jgi:hypothetical protein
MVILLSDEKKVKAKYNRRRRAVLVSGGFFLALMLGVSSDLYAEDRTPYRPAVEPKDKIVDKEQSKEPERARESVGLVGPSGEEIHDFVYPAPEKPRVVTSAN